MRMQAQGKLSMERVYYSTTFAATSLRASQLVRAVHQALAEGGRELLPVEILPDEHQLVQALLALAPRPPHALALNLHVNALEHEALILPDDAQDALGAEDIVALLLQHTRQNNGQTCRTPASCALPVLWSQGACPRE